MRTAIYKLTGAQGTPCAECDKKAKYFDELSITIRLPEKVTEIIGDGVCFDCIVEGVKGTLIGN